LPKRFPGHPKPKQEALPELLWHNLKSHELKTMAEQDAIR
jgi:hypothetical protein